jgi:tRNA nucleotidyltransferase (CCA-adding enzyme)
MKKYLKRLPCQVKDLITLAGSISASNNTPAYLVGGFVRDLILGVDNLDLDIVVEGDGIKFAEILSQKLNAGLIRHKRFGTATIIIKKGLKIDIATSRREYYPKPAHLPEVTSSVLKDDLFRRDFSINAMAISINEPDFGSLIDCFDGRKDLNSKKIRVLHNLSFIDDPTRMLRGIRFEQRYGFKIEPRTLKLFKQANKSKMLESVQPQRLRDELVLILKERDPLKPLLRIRKLTGFNFISRGLKLSKENQAFLKSIQKQINWFEKEYHKRRKLDSWLIYLIGLLEPLDINDIKELCRGYAFRKGEELRMLAYKTLKHESIKRLSREKIKPSEVYSILEPLSYETIILIKAKFKNKSLQKHIGGFFWIYNGTRTHISGNDLYELGLTPGPNYQKIFHRVLCAKLDGLVKTKNEEMELIHRLAARLK